MIAVNFTANRKITGINENMTVDEAHLRITQQATANTLRADLFMVSFPNYSTQRK